MEERSKARGPTLGKKGQAVEDKIRRLIEREDELVEPITSESWLIRGRLSHGRPVPVPPQLLQAIRPEPAQVRQPTSPSDQREQRQETLPVPLQEGHRGNLPDPIIAFCSITDLTRTAPAKTPRPVANGVMAMITAVEEKRRCEPAEDQRTASPDLLPAPYMLVALHQICSRLTERNHETPDGGRTMLAEDERTASPDLLLAPNLLLHQICSMLSARSAKCYSIV
nr:hypothetical protein PanWU01x14_222030 [Ipomoea batatas]